MKTYNVLLLIDTSRAYGRELIQGIIKYTQLYGPWKIYNDMPFFGKNRPFYDWETLKLDGIIAHCQTITFRFTPTGAALLLRRLQVAFAIPANIFFAFGKSFCMPV